MLAAIAASLNDAIVAKDLTGTIVYWNQGAETLFGFTAEEMIGDPVTRIVPPDRIDEEISILERIRCGERLTHFETQRLTRDGRTIPVSVTISPIRDVEGESSAPRKSPAISARRIASAASCDGARR